MPPKTKRENPGKMKSSPAGAALSVGEMSKDQLEEHIVRLREELDREQEERIYFQLERDKIHSFWEISTRNQEEAQSQLRNRQREREEARERHRVEITKLKQKLNHVMSEQHNITSGLKIDAVATASLVQNQHREAELRLHQELHDLQANLREKKLHDDRVIELLKQQQHLELMDQNQHYRSKVREMEVQYQKRLPKLEAEKKKQMEEIRNEEMKSHIQALLQDQNSCLRETTENYASLHRRVLQEQKELKKKLVLATQQLARTDKKLSARQENRRLTEALQEDQQKRSALLKVLEEQAKTRTVTSAKGNLDQEIIEATVGYELLLQDCQKLQQERDELLRREEETILDTQQRSDKKRLMMEEKMKVLTESLLPSSNTDRTASTRLQKLWKPLEDTGAPLSVGP